MAERIEDDWDTVARLAADLHDAHARLVAHMSTVLEGNSWAGAGIRSPEHFLVLRAGLSRGQARAVVLLARRAAELPATARALREGRISLDQAAVVARHTPAEFDETVAEFAQYATVTQLQRSVARYDFTLDESDPLQPPATDEPDIPPGDGPVEPAPPEQEPPSLSMWHGDDGRFHLAYEAPEEIGALVETALAEAKDWLIREGAGTVSHADALAVIANRSLDGVTVASRRARYRVNVFLDTDGGWLLGRPRLPQHVVEGLTCDGELVPVWETDGVPVSVGTGRRTVPERTRRLVPSVIGDVATPGATPRDGSRSTTSGTGGTAGRPTTTTSSRSAPSTTTSTTATPSPLSAKPPEPTASSSSRQEGGRSSPRRPAEAAGSPSRLPRTCTSCRHPEIPRMSGSSRGLLATRRPPGGRVAATSGRLATSCTSHSSTSPHPRPVIRPRAQGKRDHETGRTLPHSSDDEPGASPPLCSWRPSPGGVDCAGPSVLPQRRWHAPRLGDPRERTATRHRVLLAQPPPVRLAEPRLAPLPPSPSPRPVRPVPTASSCSRGPRGAGRVRAHQQGVGAGALQRGVARDRVGGRERGRCIPPGAALPCPDIANPGGQVHP